MSTHSWRFPEPKALGTLHWSQRLLDCDCALKLPGFDRADLMKAATRKSTRFVPWQGTLFTLLQEFAAVTAISFWLSVIMINTCGTLLACCLLWHSATCLPASLFLLVQVSHVRLTCTCHCLYQNIVKTVLYEHHCVAAAASCGAPSRPPSSPVCGQVWTKTSVDR